MTIKKIRGDCLYNDLKMFIIVRTRYLGSLPRCKFEENVVLETTRLGCQSGQVLMQSYIRRCTLTWEKCYIITTIESLFQSSNHGSNIGNIVLGFEVHDMMLTI